MGVMWIGRKSRLILSDDPWDGLSVPTHETAITARRVDPDAPWDFFWARNARGKYLLVLRHESDVTPGIELPKLKGIEVVDTPGPSNGSKALTFTLLNSAHKDVFFHLCSDIVTKTSAALTEKNALNIALGRTWRWHHLLRGGDDERLSRQQQKGLIGELVTIDRYLIPRLVPTDIVAAWQGPHGASKDFEIGTVAIESKARETTARPFIGVSSEYQLDTSGIARLFLCVVDLAQAPPRSDAGVTLSDMAQNVRAAMYSADEVAVSSLDASLRAAGFEWEHDYSDARWMIGTSSLYMVDQGFPRITSNGIPRGVTNVRYSVSLEECVAHLTTEDELATAIG